MSHGNEDPYHALEVFVGVILVILGAIIGGLFFWMKPKDDDHRG